MKSLLAPLILPLALLATSGHAAGEDSSPTKLPELGDAGSSLFSLQHEYQLGRAWLRSFRSQVRTVADPLLQDYLEDLIYRLATFSELKDRRLDLVIVDNKTINAFAVPGGVIGVHNGLFLHAETEDQLAAVLSHELAHLSQRHFARGVEAQQNSLPNMAVLLAGLVLAATTGGETGMAAIAAAQAASYQKQMRHSRLNEQEADRIGMQTMVKAGLNPSAAASMFENMLRAARYAGNRPPEFLLSHPVTESRVSDTRNRARQFPRQVYTDSLDYQLMRARVQIQLSDNTQETLNRLKADEHQTLPSEAQQYAMVLALIKNGQPEQARKLLQPLLDGAPHQLCYQIAQAELEIAAGNAEQAVQTLRLALSLSPHNHPLTMALANAWLKAGNPHQAEALLQQHVERRPQDPYIWYVLAETHGLAGNILGVHLARAEYFILNGVFDEAEKQLGYALALAKSDLSSSERINERRRQIQAMKNELERL